MKKAINISMALLLFVPLVAQENIKQHEAGLVFSDLNNFGICYKKGNEKSLWRFNTIFLKSSNHQQNSDSLSQSIYSYGLNFSLGKEFLREIANDFEFRFGADLTFGYNSNYSKNDDKSIDNYDSSIKEHTYKTGLAFVVGFNYITNKYLVIGVELLPGITYSSGKNTHERSYSDPETIKTDISGFDIGLSNSSARMSLAYRF